MWSNSCEDKKIRDWQFNSVGFTNLDCTDVDKHFHFKWRFNFYFLDYLSKCGLGVSLFYFCDFYWIQPTMVVVNRRTNYTDIEEIFFCCQIYMLASIVLLLILSASTDCGNRLPIVYLVLYLCVPVFLHHLLFQAFEITSRKIIIKLTVIM